MSGDKIYNFVFNLIYVTDLFLYPLKITDKLWFSNVFREYRKNVSRLCFEAEKRNFFITKFYYLIQYPRRKNATIYKRRGETSLNKGI